MENVELWVLGVIAIYHMVLGIIAKIGELTKREIFDENHFVYKIADFLEKIADFFNGNNKHKND